MNDDFIESESVENPLDIKIKSVEEQIKPQKTDKEMRTDNIDSEKEDILQTLTGLRQSFGEIRQGFFSLQSSFDSKIKYDKGKQELVDSLHRELQSYRDGFHFKILRPVFLDLIGMYDDFDNLLKHAVEDATSSETEARLRRNLASFQRTIEDILVRYGVEIYQEEGDSYVSRRQRSIGVVEIDEPELDKFVAEKVRPGFVYEGKVLRPELVKTYRYQPVQSDSE